MFSPMGYVDDKLYKIWLAYLNTDFLNHVVFARTTLHYLNLIKFYNINLSK